MADDNKNVRLYDIEGDEQQRMAFVEGAAGEGDLNKASSGEDMDFDEEERLAGNDFGDQEGAVGGDLENGVDNGAAGGELEFVENEGAVGGVEAGGNRQSDDEMEDEMDPALVDQQFELVMDALRELSGSNDREMFIGAIANLVYDETEFGRDIEEILRSKFPGIDMEASGIMVLQLFTEDLVLVIREIYGTDFTFEEAFRRFFS